jgi:hypothetical protein
MVKLEKPINLFNKLDQARSDGGASFPPISYPSESVGLMPVSLKTFFGCVLKEMSCIHREGILQNIF